MEVGHMSVDAISPDQYNCVLNWRDNVDVKLLCNKLADLSSPLGPNLNNGGIPSIYTGHEQFIGLSLFIRACLPYPEAKPSEAACDLLELSYCGENRAWLALLCGCVPDLESANAAASLCGEMIKIGSNKQWERALVEMPSYVCTPVLVDLLQSGNHAIISSLLDAFIVCSVKPPVEIQEFIRNIADNEEIGEIRGQAILLLATFQPEDTVKYADHIIESFGWPDSTCAVIDDYLSLAVLMQSGKKDHQEWCKEVFFSELKESASRTDHDIPDMCQALIKTHSPLIAEFMEQVCSEFNIETLQNIAQKIGLHATKSDLDFLQQYLPLQSPKVEEGTIWLAAALGIEDAREMAWKLALNGTDRGKGLLFTKSLAFGGSAEAITMLSNYMSQVERHFINTPGDSEKAPLLGWQTAVSVLASSIGSWSRHSPSADPVRWKALLDHLYTNHIKHERDLTFFISLKALLGMSSLCRSASLPAQFECQSDKQKKWNAFQLPLDRTPDEQISSYEPIGWGSADEEAHIGTYVSPEDMKASMLGSDRPYETDQQKALSLFEDRVDKLVVSLDSDRIQEALKHLSELDTMLLRMPVRGKDRLGIKAESEMRKAEAYHMLATRIEDETSDWHDPEQLAMQHAEQAKEYATMINDQKMLTHLAKLITHIKNKQPIPRQEDLYNEFLRLSGMAKEQEEAREFLNAIKIYDDILAWMKTVDQLGGNWEGATRYRIARCINNGIKYSGELAAGDWGPSGRLKETNEHLMDKMTELASRGKREIKVAIPLVIAEDKQACLKLLSFYEQMEQNAPWLFESISGNSPINKTPVRSSSPSPAVETNSNNSGCSILLISLFALSIVIILFLL